MRWKNKSELEEIRPYELVSSNGHIKMIKTKVKDPFSLNCKVYNDGSHFVAIQKTNAKAVYFRNEKTELQKLFDNIYKSFLMQGVKPKKIFKAMKEAMTDNCPELENVNDFVKENIKRQRQNYFSRMKRFERKVNLNVWNKFVTITYNPALHTELTFRKKLKRCLSNLHTRRGWNYIGVFELAPETKRLHFHAIMYIPNNEMIGTIEEKQDYSTKDHKMQVTHSNSFFLEKFGRNDFEELTEIDLKSGRTLEYLTKYISKTGEKLIYSRGIPSELNITIERSDIATSFIDYVEKFVLFDDCISKKHVYKPFRYISSLFDSRLCCSQ